MNPTEFVNKYKDFAFNIERETNIPAVAILAQAALESGWGKKAIGNNVFGIKYRKGDFAFQKVLTTEYHDSSDAFKGAEIKSVKFSEDRKRFKYKIWQYFADYKTPYDAFLSHARLLLSNRYKHALKHANNPKKYLKLIGESGYSTSKTYGATMSDMIDSINKRL